MISHYLIKLRQVSLISLLALSIISVIGTAMADTTPTKSPNTPYQLSDLDKASAAPLQIMVPTVSAVMTDTVLLSDPLAIASVPTIASEIGSTADEVSEPELLSKTTLSPGVTIDGLACNILHTPIGKHRWSILQYDLSLDTDNQTAVFVSDEDTRIQSVSCSADGSQVLMAIQDGAGGDSEIYLIDQTSNDIQRLTDNDTDDLDVSMSQDGKVISWQGHLADDRQAVFVRTIGEGGSYTDVALGSKFPMTQPSLSDNGEWMILVNERNRDDHIMRYQVSNAEFTTLKIVNNNRRYEVANPSISNDGTKALWTESDLTQNLIFADLEAGTSQILTSKNYPTTLIHPYLSSDGQAVIYSVSREDKRQVYLQLVEMGQVIRLGKVIRGDNQYLGNQMRATLDISLYSLAVTTVSNGSVIISPESDIGYRVGMMVTLTAVPELGFDYPTWLGIDGCDSGSSCSFVMPANNVEVVASFKEAVMPTDAIAYYPFNGNANDESENNADGVVNEAQLTTDRHNTANSAYYFDGQSYIDIPDSTSWLSADQISFSGWVNLDSPPDGRFRKIISKNKGSDVSGKNSGFYVGVNSSRVFYPVVYTDKGWVNSFRGPAIVMNSWVHLAMTWKSGGKYKVYMNGVLWGTKDAFTTQEIGDNDGLATIGALFVGGLDDIRLYDRELTAPEVYTLFNE